MFYGHNLLVSTTTSRVFREKFALKSSNELSNSNLSAMPLKNVARIVENPEIKLELSFNFKDFYRAHLSEIKYEIKLNKNKLMAYLARRGTKR